MCLIQAFTTNSGLIQVFATNSHSIQVFATTAHCTEQPDSFIVNLTLFLGSLASTQIDLINLGEHHSHN